MTISGNENSYSPLLVDRHNENRKKIHSTDNKKTTLKINMAYPDCHNYYQNREKCK